MIVTVGFWLGVFVLFYVYGGYYGFLTLLSRLKRKEKSLTHKTPKNDCLPAVSIVITVFNEEQNIRKRIENLMHVDYDPKKVEVIVASDGSADRTVELARQSNYPNIVVLDFKVRRGRALTQNDAVATARGDIVVFTDANTEFHQDFLKNVVKHFSEETVGCVVGNLVYRTKTSAMSTSEGFYFRFEKRIRELESGLGILATATGACMAVRKSLWKRLSPSDDCDFTTPLDMILQGYSVVFATDALAFDEPADSPRQEFRTRVRQTSKNLAGTIRRWGWKGVLRHPAVTFGLFSHKVLRWLTPYFMLLVLVCNLILWQDSLLYKLSLFAQGFLYALALIGAILNAVGLSSTGLPGLLFSFCVANLGMAVGVAKAIVGRVPSTFSSAERP